MRHCFLFRIFIYIISNGHYAGEILKISLQKGSVTFYILQLGRDDALIRRNLGHAYLAEDNIAEALNNWQAALQFNPYDQKTKDLVEKYSSG